MVWSRRPCIETGTSFAARLRKKGKPHNVIVAAGANRWLRRLDHLMQPDQPLAA